MLLAHHCRHWLGTGLEVDGPVLWNTMEYNGKEHWFISQEIKWGGWSTPVWIPKSYPYVIAA